LCEQPSLDSFFCYPMRVGAERKGEGKEKKKKGRRKGKECQVQALQVLHYDSLTIHVRIWSALEGPEIERKKKKRTGGEGLPYDSCHSVAIIIFATPSWPDIPAPNRSRRRQRKGTKGKKKGKGVESPQTGVGITSSIFLQLYASGVSAQGRRGGGGGGGEGKEGGIVY